MKYVLMFMLSLCVPMGYAAPAGQLFESEQSAKHMIYDNLKDEYADIVWQAEQNATGKAKDVLYMARVMTLDERFMIKGGCWDYLNAVSYQLRLSRY